MAFFARQSLAQVPLLCSMIAASGCGGCLGKSVPDDQKPRQAMPPGDPGASAPQGSPAASGAASLQSGHLEVTDLKTGTGPAAAKGKKLKVHYTGSFLDGKTFDSSAGKEPLSFTLGGGEVIQGWERGLDGLRVGGKRRLVIPPDLAYGEQGYPGTIPPRSTLVFEIELLGVE